MTDALSGLLSSLPGLPGLFSGVRRLRRAPSAALELCTLDRVDDADAWTVPTTAPGDAVDWLRRTYGDAPGVLRRPMLLGWRLCGAELGPVCDPDHVLGWRIDLAEPARARMVVRWRIGLTAQLVVVDRPGGFTLASFVATGARPARLVWAVLGPAHRVVTWLMLALAVRRAQAHPGARGR